MAVSIADFRVRFPQFGTTGTAAGEVTDARVQMYLDDATAYLADYASCIGATLDIATYYLAAHYISIQKQFDSFGNPITIGTSSTNGQLKRIKIGNIEKEYNYTSTSQNISASDLLNSEYGRVCWDMIKKCVLATTTDTTSPAMGAVTL